MTSITKIRQSRAKRGGFTFIDNVVAMTIFAGFFIALYSINTQCLQLVSSSRQALAAGESLQDRMEQVRTCTWAQITDSNYISSSILNTAANNAPLLGSITEVITVNAYPTAVNPPIQVTRASNGTVTVNSTNATIKNGDLVAINIQLSWTAARGSRARSMAINTIWGENSR